MKPNEELISRFLESIQSTVKSGNEEGFDIFKRNGLLYPGKTYYGKGTSIQKPDKVKFYAEFHTHTFLWLGKDIQRKTGSFPPIDIIRVTAKMFINSCNEKIGTRGINSLNTPSFHDLLCTISLKYQRKSSGIIYIGNDVDTDFVECWSLKKHIPHKYYHKAKKSLTEKTDDTSEAIPQWVYNLFDKEEIILTKPLNT